MDQLVSFFDQFNETPTTDQFKTYLHYMKQITAKINKSEEAYYLDKYTKEYPEDAEKMALLCLLNSFKDLPTRMQYWASSDEHGGTIRNPESHKMAVKSLNKWASLHPSLQEKHLFFHQNDTDKKIDGMDSLSVQP